MKGLGALLLLVQLLSCKAVPLGPFHPLHPRVIDCDDPESEAAAAVALDYINTHHLHGYKYALNSIEKIKVLPRRPTGEIFELELDLLETVCHIVNPLPVENCTVRPLTEYVVEGDCDVKLLKLDGSFSVLATKCHSTPDSAEDITKNCPDCPIFALLNDTQVITAVDLALAQYNGGQDGAYFKLLEIGRAQIQVTVETMILAILQNRTSLPWLLCNAHLLVFANKFVQGYFGSGALLLGPPLDKTKVPIYDKLQVTEHTNRTDGFLFQPGVTHRHLIQDHLGGQLPTVVQGFKHHDLRHFHHGSLYVTSESTIPVVKRDVGAVVDPAIPAPPVGPGPKHPVCPGRIRHFQV
uniref:Alpha 2-HS glycoprotein n=1 Tax=Chrysemys picta bellii TaxID=8478 RepID=A0A8C3F0X8_CHRPI